MESINTRLKDIKFTCKYNDTEINVEIADDLFIDEENINSSFIDQPAKFAWYSSLCNEARREVDTIKNEIATKEAYINKTLYALLDRRVRNDMELNCEKITEGKVESGVYADKEYQQEMDILSELRDTLIAADYKYNMLMTIVSAFNQRKDVLISYGANRRAELASIDLKINENVESITTAEAIRRNKN